jgi:hypothetical protein
MKALVIPVSMTGVSTTEEELTRGQFYKSKITAGLVFVIKKTISTGTKI